MTVTPPIEDWTLVEVRATLRYNPGGAPIVGYLRFTPTALRSVSVADRAQIAIATSRQFPIGPDGTWTATLPATDDPAIIGVDGTPFAYLVQEEFPGGSSYHVTITSAKAATGVSLGEIAGAQPGLVPGVTRDELDAAVNDAQAAAADARRITGIDDLDSGLDNLFVARYDTDPDGTLVIVTGESPSEGGTPGGGSSFDDAAATAEFLAAVDF